MAKRFKPPIHEIPQHGPIPVDLNRGGGKKFKPGRRVGPGIGPGRRVGPPYSIHGRRIDDLVGRHKRPDSIKQDGKGPDTNTESKPKGNPGLNRQALKRAHGMSKKDLLAKTQALTTKFRNTKYGLPGGGNADNLDAIRARLMAFRKGLGQELLGKKSYSNLKGQKIARNRAIQKKLGNTYLDYYTYKARNPKYGKIGNPNASTKPEHKPRGHQHD